MSSNLYAQFARLLPGQPVLVGTVVSSADGTTVVDLPGGTSLTVRGEASVGASVFVRGGAVECVAPSFTFTTLEV